MHTPTHPIQPPEHRRNQTIILFLYSLDASTIFTITKIKRQYEQGDMENEMKRFTTDNTRTPETFLECFLCHNLQRKNKTSLQSLIQTAF